jgi:hypothetical protein
MTSLLEITELLENRYGDYHVEQAFRAQRKRRTQRSGESLKEFTAVMTTCLTVPTWNYPNT